MSNRKYAQNDLIDTVCSYGFCAVQLWRSSLKPLSMIEAEQGREPYEVPGGFGDMFDVIQLPGTSTQAALEFGQKQGSAGGFKVGMNLLGKLLGTIGGKAELGASAQGVKEFLFEFKDTVVEQTSVDLLVRACSKARPNNSVLKRIKSEHLQRFVVIRSLEATSIICTALDKKGAKLGLNLDLGKLPATADLEAEVNKDGGITLRNGAGQPLVFGIDYYQIEMKEDLVAIGGREDDARSIRMITRAETFASLASQYKLVDNITLGGRVEPVPRFINIGHK